MGEDEMTPRHAFVVGYLAAYQHSRREPLSDMRIDYLIKLAEADWNALATVKTDANS